MNGIELLYDYLEDHVRAAAVIRERRPLAFGVACFVFSGLSFFVAQTFAARLAFLGFSFSAAALAVLWKVVAGFVLASIIHMVVEMSGRSPGTGGAASLFVLFGLADLTWAAAVPLLLLARAFTSSQWPVTAIFLITGLIVMALKARGLQDNYQVSSGRAWLTLSVPYIAAAGLAFAFISLAVVGLILKVVQAIG